MVASARMLSQMGSGLSLHDMGEAARHTPAAAIAISLLATMISFACLAYYDRFASEAIAPGRIERKHACFTGGVSHAFSNTLGFPALTGTAMRYRLYGQRGLPAPDIARVTVLAGLCVGLGSLCVFSLALLGADESPAWAKVAATAGLLGLLGVVASYPAWSIRLRLRDSRLPTASRVALLLPLGTGVVEATAAILALYVLLPAESAMPFAKFVALATGAMLLGVLSHAPGGVGVFEATILAAFPASSRSGILAALLVYRLLYNLLPFFLSCAALGVQQARTTSIGGRVARHQPLLRQVQSRQTIHADGTVASATVGRRDLK
ncbi:MAG: UPF0104 family protein [Pseudoxanthomonas sp.]